MKVHLLKWLPVIGSITDSRVQAPSTLSGTTREYNLDIVNARIAPDGFSRNGVTINGVFPGLTITALKGESLRITVNNRLTDPTMDRSTAIHWHGLLMDGTGWADGPAHANQCPISPNGTLTYEFHTADQAGTFWYHSHLRSQYPDGTKGVLVIYDPNDPLKQYYDVDNEDTILQLSDWYHTPSPELLRTYFSEANAGNSLEPQPDSGVINGFGRCKVDCPKDAPYYVNTVERGKRYRFRVINTSAFAKFEFSIDQHDFQVIELDGVSHQPNTYQRFNIWPGQRISVVVNANKAVGNYWIRAQMEVTGSTPNLDTDVRGILRYTGAPNANPTSQPAGSSKLMDEMAMRPLDGKIVGGKGRADITVNLEFKNDKTDTKPERTIWEINGSPYHSPQVPTLTAILYNNARTLSDFPRSSNIILIDKPNAVVDFKIKGNRPVNGHPFHLHGHVFSVLSNDGTDADLSKLTSAPQRDVIAVHGGGVHIRFIADNPGVWFLHCHIDWHLEAGLAAIVVERPSEIPGRVQPPQQWKDLCPIYDALPDELK
ncbi:hypothetical protein HK104_004534 [Borealophlyctis nickersoniae]|nr:hypothetical protein HK104_004534 [Borealophlyctis nickersoniae]